MEYLQEHLLSNEQPPMKNVFLESDSMKHMCKETLLFYHPSVNHQTLHLKPSFSYSSVKEELSNYIKKMDVSSAQLSQNRPYFIFGKLKEAKKLLHSFMN